MRVSVLAVFVAALVCVLSVLRFGAGTGRQRLVAQPLGFRRCAARGDAIDRLVRQ
jgi:hypothetical protein